MDISVGIPVFNCATTIKATLDRLTFMRIPNLRVICYDNGSLDGSMGLLSELVGRKYYQMQKDQDSCTLNLSCFQGQHYNQHKHENILLTRQKIGELVQTEYVFFMDSDIILPANALQLLLEEFKKTNAMFMGIKYEPKHSDMHVMFGATIWKTADFRQLPVQDFDARKSCDCKFATDWARAQGRPAEHHPWLMAQHWFYHKSFI